MTTALHAVLTARSQKILVDRTGRQLSDLMAEANSDIHGPFETLSDIYQGRSLNTQRLGRGGEIHSGRIQYALPHIGWYRVAVDDGHGVVPCCAAEMCSSSSIVGPRSTGGYGQNAEVLVFLFRNPSGFYGIILGAIPNIVDDANVQFPDWVVQGSGVGIKRDGYYTNYLQLLGDEGGALDFSNSRPVDQLSSDWGVMAETGVGLHLDSFMVNMKVDEVCGVWFHYQDQHTCLAGISLDVLTGAHIEQYRDDEGECTSYRGEATYPWELMGCFFADVPNFVETPDADVHLETHTGKYEPKEPDQQSFFRYEEYGGYLGQGKLRQMCVPPPDVSGSSVYAFDSEQGPVGVFREHIGLDGSYALESAKSVVIAKRSLIPWPKRKKLPEDYSNKADGAEQKNYKAAGQYGEGKAHAINDLQPEGEHQSLLSVAGVMEMHAHAFNWKALHSFHYHEQDYQLPEEDSGLLQQVQATPDFESLATTMWLPRPEPKMLRVDHRYNDVNYFEVLSHLTLTDDGGLVLQGGNGEEIRFVAGSIQLSCPGNIYLQPGKSVVALAGDDAIVRARNSVDISSSNKDVRIKAENNLQMLSGNSGHGGTLIENRAVDDDQYYPSEGGEEIRGSGVIIKCENSLFSTMSSEVYIRTGNNKIGEGPIVFDASRGQNDVRFIARNIVNYVKDSIYDAFVSSGDKVRSVSRTSETATQMGSSLYVNGSALIQGFALVKGPVQSSDGHFASSRGGPADKLRNPASLRNNIDERTSVAEAQTIAHVSDDYSSNVATKYYESKKIGNKEYQSSISFSLRNEREYGTTDFKLPQTHWQLIEEASGGGVAWTEPDVKYQADKKKQPWPGKEAWEDVENFLTLTKSSYTLYDIEKGISKPRSVDDNPYEEAKYGEFVHSSPRTGYKVINCP